MILSVRTSLLGGATGLRRLLLVSMISDLDTERRERGDRERRRVSMTSSTATPRPGWFAQV